MDMKVKGYLELKIDREGHCAPPSKLNPPPSEHSVTILCIPNRQEQCLLGGY